MDCPGSAEDRAKNNSNIWSRSNAAASKPGSYSMPDPTTLGDGCPAAWTARPLIAALLVLLAALLIAARAPYLFTTPRFWAEEGEVFFAQAFTHPWYQMPLFAHAGYPTWRVWLRRSAFPWSPRPW